MSLWGFILKGGPLMVPIILGSIIGLSIVIERFYIFRKVKTDNGMLFKEIEELAHRGEIRMAESVCERTPGPVSAIFLAGLKRHRESKGYRDIDSAMQEEGSIQLARLERGLTGLGIIVTVEPMLGFLGTIIGLISAFMKWERLGANVSINVLAGGMYQAMITTAAGLTIAIPYYIAYNWFVKKTQGNAKEMDVMHTKFLQLLFPSKEKSAELI